MLLKKFLKSFRSIFNGKKQRHLSIGQRGQSALEYFILLALLVALTAIGSSRIFLRAQSQVERFTNTAVEKISPASENN